MKSLEPIIGSLKVGGLHWRFAGHGVPGLQELNLAEHLKRGTATIIKHGPQRTVYRVQLDGFNIFWKHCRISGPAAFLRQMIRPPKARMEFDRARLLLERGIATIEPLAWGQSWWWPFGPSHLVTRELLGATPLSAYLFEHATGRSRREAAQHLGGYLASLHEAGIAHPDLHPGNILVVLDANQTPVFHLIDLHNLRIGQPLSAEEGCENLVVLNRWFALRSERTDRHRFWQSYAQARGLGPKTADRLARQIETRTVRSNFVLWADRVNRCFGSNRYFQRLLSPIARGHAVKDLDPAIAGRFLDDPDWPFRDPQCRLLKDSATSTVAEVVIDSRTWIYKRFCLKKRWAALANLFRRSAALRSWQMGHALIERGLPTARPLLVLHRRGITGPREGYLLCEKIENASELHRFVAHQSVHDKQSRIDQVARLLRRFHDAGLSHRDLKAGNLLVAANAGDAKVHFIDLVGVRLRPQLTPSQRQQDLMRLNVSFLKGTTITRTDRLRFLRSYCCWALKGRADWKVWWRQIARATLAKISRNIKSGRPIG